MRPSASVLNSMLNSVLKIGLLGRTVLILWFALHSHCPQKIFCRQTKIGGQSAHTHSIALLKASMSSLGSMECYSAHGMLLSDMYVYLYARV